jgi:hypothetical protein
VKQVLKKSCIWWKQYQGFQTEKEVTEWLSCDAADPGFQTIEGNEIVSSVLTETYTSDIDDESAADDESNPDIPTHSKAFTCLDKALQWFEVQDESCDSIKLFKENP